MIGAGCRRKGRNFEKKIAREFGQWWCADALAFYCNIGSGSRSTVIGQVYGGDIIPVKDIACWPLCVEVKKQERWSIEDLLLNVPSEPLFSYLGQVICAARVAVNDIPLLVCAKNYRAPIIFFPYSYIQVRKLRAKNLHYLRFCSYRIPTSVVKKYNIVHIDMGITTLDQFFAYFSPSDFAR